jgi:hypothetical protein
MIYQHNIAETKYVQLRELNKEDFLAYYKLENIEVIQIVEAGVVNQICKSDMLLDRDVYPMINFNCGGSSVIIFLDMSIDEFWHAMENPKVV